MKKNVMLGIMAMTMAMTVSGTVFGEEQLTEDQKLVVDTVNEMIQSEKFTGWTEQYKEFKGEEGCVPEITEVLYYQYPDQDADGYLVNIAAGVGYFVDEEKQCGAAEESFRLYIDRETQAVYDNITLDAAAGAADLKTEEDVAKYLLWIYGNMQDGSYEGTFFEEKESVSVLTADEVTLMNQHLVILETEDTTEQATFAELPEEVMNLAAEFIQSEAFIGWTEQYKEFTGNESKTPEITEVLYYQYSDQNADGYLINIAAGVGYFWDEAGECGAVEESVRLYVDRETNNWYDSITLNAAEGTETVETEEDLAKYLLWIYGNMQDGSYEGYFFEEREQVMRLDEEAVASLSLADGSAGADYEIVRTSEVVTEDGMTIVHGYNKDDIQISEIVTDADGNVYEHRYDLDGNHIFESGTLTDGSYHEFEYDTEGNVVKESHSVKTS